MAEADSFDLKASAERLTIFGFFGSANSLNVQAVVAFADHLVRTGEQPEGLYEIHIYGTLCNRLNAPLPEFVKVKGLLADPRDFYRHVDCVLNFQEASTGLKIKIAEALSFGAPLISLAHAFEGFGRPAHPAQACESLSVLVEQMRRAATDPAYLAQIARASQAVEQALEQRTERMADRLFGHAETDPAMIFVVDGAAYARSPVYRHMVASFRLAFVRSWPACLFLAAGQQPAGEYRAFADSFGRIADERDLAALASKSVLLLLCAASLSAEVIARFAQVVLVETACDYARSGAAHALLATAPTSMLVVRARGDGPVRHLSGEGSSRPQLQLSFFRWMPWDLAWAQRPQHFTKAAEWWLFHSEEPDEAFVRLMESVAAPQPLRRFSDPAEVNQLLFEDRQVPTAVVIAGPGQQFALALEWLVATGIEVRRLPRPGGTDQDLAPPRFLPSISALVRPVEPRQPEPAKPLGDWQASGWSDLAELIGHPEGV